MPGFNLFGVRRLFSSGSDDPEPIEVDFQPGESGMFIVLRNLEAYPLRETVIRFSQPLPGPSGRDLGAANLFRRLRYFAPGRDFRVYAGPVETFLSSLRDTRMTVRIRTQLPKGEVREYEIEHDLAIYIDLPRVETGRRP